MSHLQFVDDTTLAGRARIREAEAFRFTLDTYLAASRQKINDHKSSIFFFNTPEPIQWRIATILRFQIQSLPLTYLGVPIVVGRQPRLFWQNVIDKLRQKVNHWTHRWLSTTTRVTLLQSVIQALPIYRCMVQAAPVYFLKEFDALSRQFLWSGNLQNTKWSLINWDTVCRPKKEGGLGLRSAILCGQALAAKLYWRWCSNQSQLWAHILSYKYYPGVDPPDISRLPLEGRGSMVWNTLKLGANLVKHSLFWICNSGTVALFWSDSWDGYPPLLSSHPHLQSLCDLFLSAGWNTVAHYKEAFNLGTTVGYRWKNSFDWPPGGSLGDRLELSQILASRECSSLRECDVLAWGGASSGKYSVSSGYLVLTKQLFGEVEVSWWKKVWNSFSWPKCNFFLWVLVYNRCLTWDNLCKRGFQGPSICVLCRSSDETVSHLFFQCPFAKQIWHLWWSVWGCSCWHVSSLSEFWDRLGHPPAKASFLQVAWSIGPSLILWHLWLERNRRIFQDVHFELRFLWGKIINSLHETLQAKCDVAGGLDPIDAGIYSRFSFAPPSDTPYAPHTRSVNGIRQHLHPVNREGHWTPPAVGVLKINTDGSSRGNPGPAGIGGVARDSSGDIQFFFSIYKGYHTNNLMEALAILVAVEQCCQCGWRRIICETDSQVVVNLLNKRNYVTVDWHLAVVVQQIIQLCTSLDSVTFMHIPREWNGVADCLAKWASEHGPPWNIFDYTMLPLNLSQKLAQLVDQDKSL